MIEGAPRVAVPLSVIAQEVRPGPVAFPCALHLIEVESVNDPSAVPVNFRSPGQVALNDPFALLGVCSETFHTKFVQVLGVGMSVEELQLPSIALFPATDGPVSEL